MFIFNKLKLLAKIILFIVFFLSLSIGIYLTFFIQSQVQHQESEILKNGLIFSELSALVLYQDYLTASARGFPTFEDVARERLKKNPDITRTMLLATNGKIIFDSNDFATGVVSGRTGGGVDRFIENPSTLELLQENKVAHKTIYEGNERFTEIVVPIVEVGGGHVFSMRYLLSYRSLQALRVEIFKDSLITLLPLFLLFAAVGVILAISIVRPITSLYRATERIQAGDLNIQLPVKSNDEIGKLTSGFNQMVTTIATTQQQLKQSNQQLESQVAQRTQELQAKLTELERMNNLMVGRELKMVELKKEIEALKSAK